MAGPCFCPLHRTIMKLTAILTLGLALLQLLPASPTLAETEARFPTWGSIAASRAHLRVGPGQRFEIKWVFTAPSMPVQITDRHENWREVTTPGGITGWMHHSLLSRRLTVWVNEEATLRRHPADDAKPLARIMSGAVVDLLDPCGPAWCRVKAGRWKGYLAQPVLWGPTDPE